MSLLYVGGNNDAVTVYSFPKGKLVATIGNPYFDAPTGFCTDRDGNVFITNLQTAQVFEYSAGGYKLLDTLEVPSQYPDDCAVDPVTGNLAVASLGFEKSANVAIYAHARGTPKTYTDPDFASFWYCGYDQRGNLYVDGQDRSDNFEFARLGRGSRKMRRVVLSHTIGWPGTVQWLGHDLTVEDRNANSVYRFKISGNRGRFEGATTLEGGASGNIGPTWIQGTVVLGIEHGVGAVQYWHYPSGGQPTRTITNGIAGPDGLTASSP